MTEFNYKNIHFWLLSFFAFLLILALTGQIKSANDSDFITKYSIFGIFICLISWNIEDGIFNETKDYHFQDYMVTDILEKIGRNRWILLGHLGITFILNFLLPEMWYIFYIGFFILYLLALGFNNLIQ